MAEDKLNTMNEEQALDMLNALAQESRLAIFRLLVTENSKGLAVGEISRQLDILQSTLSGHLAILKRAKLIKSTRHQREIHYAANLESMSKLVRFMLEDCCNGKIENCKEILSFFPASTPN